MNFFDFWGLRGAVLLNNFWLDRWGLDRYPVMDHPAGV